jgi:hypothetical protein
VVAMIKFRQLNEKLVRNVMVDSVIPSGIVRTLYRQSNFMLEDHSMDICC